MERLTMRDENGDVRYRLDALKPFDNPPTLGREKLFAYEEAEEQGLLVRLPCKVGDTVYLTIGAKKKIQKATVDMFHIDRMGLEVEAVYSHFGLVCFCGRLGVNVFTTPEEAEAELAKED